MSDWHLYMLRCGGGELYTGISTDVQRRLQQHGNGRGAKALRGKGPLELLRSAPVGNRSQAQKVEAHIKRLGKPAKEALAAAPDALAALIKDQLDEDSTA